MAIALVNCAHCGKTEALAARGPSSFFFPWGWGAIQYTSVYSVVGIQYTVHCILLKVGVKMISDSSFFHFGAGVFPVQSYTLLRFLGAAPKT